MRIQSICLLTFLLIITSCNTVDHVSEDGGNIPLTSGMKLIPAKDSSFQMGCNTGTWDEAPVHTVRFTYDFWMDSTEVTQGKYDSVMTEVYQNYSRPSWDAALRIGENNSAYYVSWFDAVLFCNARSKLMGIDTVYTYSSITGALGNGCELNGVEIHYGRNGYRLPTEAEWEYACRAGTTTDYYWEDGIIDEFAWYEANNESKVQTVAMKKPNRFGLYDMSGSLWEWCNDRYYEYDSTDQTDPIGAVIGSIHVLRGGCLYDVPFYLRSSDRYGFSPTSQCVEFGFRVCYLDR